MSKQNQWIVGVNAVASAIENDADNVREVLVEGGSKNARLTEIDQDLIDGSPLWLRAEPDHDLAQADALAAVVSMGLMG